MIFYTIRAWLQSLGQLFAWADTDTIHAKQILEGNALEDEILEGRIDAILEGRKVWRVRYLATFWTARSGKEERFSPGDYIKIVGRKGLVLLIEPMEEND